MSTDDLCPTCPFREGGDSMTKKSEQEAQLRAATHLPAPPVITPAQRAERQRKLRNAK